MSSEVELVLAAESALLDPAIRSNAVELDRLLDAEFMEIGGSGRVWNRANLIADLVASPHIDEVLLSDLSARHVTDDVIVVQYTTSTPGRTVRRSSWWRRADGWRYYFHQGTVIAQR